MAINKRGCVGQTDTNNSTTNHPRTDTSEDTILKLETTSPTGERVGGFLNLNDFPAAAALAADLCASYRQLTEEALQLVKGDGYTAWPESINGGGWFVSGVRWQGSDMDNVAPVAAGIVRRHPAALNAGYSLMRPGTEIHPHVGYTGDVVRLHVGLIVPQNGDCALVVGGERREWEPGAAFLFDDTVLHSAHNRTPHGRIIFLADVRREV